MTPPDREHMEGGDEDRRFQEERRVENATLLARIDERTRGMRDNQNQMKLDLAAFIANADRRFVTHEEFKAIKETLDDIAGKDTPFVSKEAFHPIKLIVYALMAAAGGAVLTGIIKMVVPG